MKFCPVVPEICRGQVHVPKKTRRKRRKRIIIIIIIIIIMIMIRRNGAKTISLPNVAGFCPCFGRNFENFEDSNLFL